MGKEKNERVQQKTEAIRARSIRLKRLYENYDFRILKDWLMEKESMAYFSLKHPETRKDTINSDYYFGYMSGRLSLIDEERELFERAIISLAREALRQEQENERKGE